MSPKRRQRIDEPWDRTPNGLLVPRKPTLPTRRFIQKWGQVPCCCDETIPTTCCDDLPATWLVDILSGGWTNQTCDHCEQVVADSPYACVYVGGESTGPLTWGRAGDYIWEYKQQDMCVPVRSSIARYFMVHVILDCGGNHVSGRGLYVYLFEWIQWSTTPPSPQVVYTAAAYFVTMPAVCPAGFYGLDGKITLDKFAEDAIGLTQSPCTLSPGMPATIKVEAG